jgi:hypothetical protein
VQATEQPADTEGDGGGCVGLRFNRRPYPFVEAGRALASRVCSLAVQVLGCASSLVELSLMLGFGVANHSTCPFFDLAADVFGSPEIRFSSMAVLLLKIAGFVEPSEISGTT